MRFQLAIAALLFPSAQSEASCAYFKFHSAVEAPLYLNSSACDYSRIDWDSDGDGIRDWGFRPEFGELLLPNDDDIDGDGIQNVLDFEPFVVNLKPSNTPSHLPSHLLGFSSLRSERDTHDVQMLQNVLFQETGIIAIEYDDSLSKELLLAVIDIYRRALSTSTAKKLTRLKYIYAFQRLDDPRAVGYFIEPLNAISVLGTNGLKNANFEANSLDSYSSVAHEIGHAVVFSLLTPKSLVEFAQKYANWPISDAGTFYDSSLFRRFSGSPHQEMPFPSMYARTNVHEWFAESFSAYVIAKTGKGNIQNAPIYKFFDELLSL
jgi:hypothetical protein